MHALIQKSDLSSEFSTSERCFIVEVARDDALSIARARVEPGVTTRWHRLNTAIERYYILSGVGRVEVGELPPTQVTAGDVVVIPPRCPQRIANIGPDDLLFLALCTPPFTPADYEEIDGPDDGMDL